MVHNLFSDMILEDISLVYFMVSSKWWIIAEGFSTFITFIGFLLCDASDVS